MKNSHFDWDKKTLASRLAIPVSIVAVSFAAILVRFSNSSAISIAFYRMFFSTIILSLLVPRYLEELKEITKKELTVLLTVGFLLAVHMVAWISSLDYTSVTSSVVLVTAHPLLVAWISSWYLGEKTGKKAYLAIAVALVGIAIMTISDYHSAEWSVFGDFLAIIGMIAVSGYIIYGREMRQKLSVIPYALIVYGSSTVFLLAFSPLFSPVIKVFSLREYAIFLSLALVPTMLGHTVYNWALKYVKARIMSVSLLGEPIGSSILAFLILEEIPGYLTIFGAGVALVGIYYCAKFE